MKYRNFESMPIALTVRDVADTLEIGRNLAYDLVKSGQLHCLRVGNQIRIPREHFIAFLSGESTPA